MKKIFSAFLFCIITVFTAKAQDTIRVQAMTYESSQDTFVVFPPDTFGIEKIIMNYRLRCPYTVQCGEWDYLSYTYLYKPTGQFDSVSHVAPNYTVNGASPDSFQLMYSPSYSYYPYFENFIVYNNVVSYDSAVVGGNYLSTINPFNTGLNVSRTQYLWKAAELTAAGVQPGDITNLKFFLNSNGDLMDGLIVRMKAVTRDSITATSFENTGFTTVYERNTLFGTGGLNSIDLTWPFNWDGTSDLVIDFSFTNPSPALINTVSGDTSNFKSGITLAQADRSRFFEGSDYINVPQAALATIDSFITISFWAKGNPAYMPENTSIFEAWDTSGFRVLNIHLPWSDEAVYWDAGNNGSSTFNRVSIATAPADYEGNWTYWTFVKNAATGRMKIYKNGVSFIQNPQKWFRMYGIERIRIGAGLNNSNFYDGNLDDFAIFNAELDTATIRKYMYRRIDATHPFYSNLLMYYTFDETQDINTTAYDSSPNGFNGEVFGIPQSQLFQGTEIFKNFSETNERPQVVFGQGVYNSYVDSMLLVDSTENAPLSVILYDDTLNPTAATDTLIAWNSYYSGYLYDSTGTAIDSSFVNPDSTIHLQNTTYYDPPYEINDRYEIGRFITPYGNGLSLGNGFMWKFDVSDYEPLLHDTVHLAAGNWQELLDLSFDIIKGTPPRDVQEVKNIWNGGIGYGANTETALDERRLYIPPGADNTRLKVRLTGHGADNNNCSEFCVKSCFVYVDSILRFSKAIWRDDCPVNPLYPQGGTWVYPRANWCPGAEVETYDVELSPYTTPGDSVLLNLNLTSYVWPGGGSWPYYQTETQLITYGPPNFTLDAGVYEIKSPSDKQLYLRMNPICNNPLITIQNTGTDPLTSLTITYGLVGGTPSTYTWGGNLGFMQKVDVRLENFAWNSTNLTFYVTLSNPNGSTDQYAQNNTAWSTFNTPDEYVNQLIFEFKTNNQPNQNAYDIKDDQGNLIFHKGGGLTPNTYYNDTISFASGCYEFRMTDSGENGLTWWANPSGGSGYMRIKRASDGLPIISFNSDFGGEIYKQFTVGYLLNTDDLSLSDNVHVFPNPSSGLFQAELFFGKSKDVRVEVYSASGKLVYMKQLEDITNEVVEIKLEDAAPGIYTAHFRTSSNAFVKKLVVTR